MGYGLIAIITILVVVGIPLALIVRSDKKTARKYMTEEKYQKWMETPWHQREGVKEIGTGYELQEFVYNILVKLRLMKKDVLTFKTSEKTERLIKRMEEELKATGVVIHAHEEETGSEEETGE